MLQRLKNRFKFIVERWLLRGAHYRLLVIAILIGLISGVAGLLVYAAEAGFNNAWEAIWWAFLRLTDPGYLGDDEGILKRTISTVVTVLGYVIFLGALIAIMTQWLNQTITKLESGFTPIAQNKHVLILGWTNRTASIVQQLVLSEERVKHFLRRRGARRLSVVILDEFATPERIQELRDRLGTNWDPNQVILRSGTPLSIDHLRRVDFLNASAIILPGADYEHGGADATDTRTIKTLLSISNHGQAETPEDLPRLVTEIFDTRKLSIARRAYDGRIEILASSSFIGRLIAQNVRHRGLSHVYAELLAHGEGNEVYVRTCLDEFVGLKLHAISSAFPHAILLGAVRPNEKSFSPLLNPPDDFVLAEDDRLVLLANSYEESSPQNKYTPQPIPGRTGPEETPRVLSKRRILLLGWSQKVPALLREFDSYPSETFEIDILSAIPVKEREEYLERFDLHLQQVRLGQFEGDYTIHSDLRQVHPETYNNIVLVGSDWLDSGEESDARTILGYLLLRDLFAETGTGPEILVELMDPENVSLFQRRRAEILVSPLILSHMLGQVALRRELRAVFDELFGPGGAEIFFRPVADYGLAGCQIGFQHIQELARERGEIALGVRIHTEIRTAHGGLRLNPEDTQNWTFDELDELVVLSTYQ
ncbi:MAG: ion channel DMI1 [bacterium]|nr:ion channel DMI1 [bacterium]